MRNSLPITRTRGWWPIVTLLLLFAVVDNTAGAEEPPTDQAPPVFQPNEIQHGFAEYDRPPDFSSDDTPSPYEGYSKSPILSDQKPEGVFQNLQFAEGVEDERTARRGHFYIPVNPTSTFPATVPSVYLVFAVHKHLSSYQVIGRLFRENVTGIDSTQALDEDIVELATEDESGFLKFFPPSGSWQAGQYRVDVYVGYMANPMNKMGAMRFTVDPAPARTSSP